MSKIKSILIPLLILAIMLPTVTSAYGGGIPPIFGPGFHQQHEPKTPKIKKEFGKIIERLDKWEEFEERIFSKLKKFFSLFK